MISIIVATDDDLLIGKKDSSNGMPWHNKEDLQHFKKTTLNQTILMGKTTYLAIGRPLPNRKTIVVTKSGMDDERVEVRPDLGFAILLRVSNVGLVVGDWRIATEADLPGCRGHHQMLSVRDAAYSQREPLPWLPALWFMPSPQRG